MDLLDKAIDLLTDPIHGSPSKNHCVCGVLCLHVDDLFMAGDAEFLERVVQALRRDFQIGSEDKNDIMFVGQRIRWTKDSKGYPYIRVDQDLCIDELNEITYEKGLSDSSPCPPSLHTSYRSVLGQINWLQ